MTAINESDNKKKEFSDRLRKLRMEKGLSQRAFTKLIDLNYTQYNRYENAERLPSSEILSKLSEVLEVSVDYLLDGNVENAAMANIEDKELLHLFEAVEKISIESKEHIKAVIKAFVKQDRQKEIASI
jgi:transcriptional regulator with XRE-family HTH domain